MKHASHTENRFVCLCEGCGNRPFNAPTEQSQWVSVKDLTIIEDERYLVFDPDQNHPSMIFRLMDGQFIKSVSEDCQAVLVTPPTQESDT